MNGSKITWDETLRRGATQAGHQVAILRSRATKLRMVAVKMPPGGTILEVFRGAFDEADAMLQAEELVNWPSN